MGSVLKVDKLDPQSGTALEIGTSGDTITVPSGATFAVSGTMNASSITAGTVATARLGSGTASSSTVLYGDQTYKTEPTGGKVLQVVQNTTTTTTAIEDSTVAVVIADLSVAITPSATTSKILVHMNCGGMFYGAVGNLTLDMLRDTTTVVNRVRHGYGNGGSEWVPCPLFIHYLDSPATTSAITYTFKYGFSVGVSVGGQANPEGGTNPGIVIAMEIGA